MNAQDKLLLTPEEVGQMLGLSRSRIYELLRDGTIDSVKVGRLRRIPRTVIELYVEGLTGRSHSTATLS